MTAAACLAYTAAEGWHLAEVDLDLIVQCERDALPPAARPRPVGPKQTWKDHDAPCGTVAGYHRHVRNSEQIDSACREARRVDQRERRARNRAQAAA